MIQGHRDAHPVALGVPEQPGQEVPVVEDVVVAERRALGEPGRAARVLDVDRLVAIEQLTRRADLIERGAARRDLLPFVEAEEDRSLQLRKLGADLVDHRDEIGALHLARGEQETAA